MVFNQTEKQERSYLQQIIVRLKQIISHTNVSVKDHVDTLAEYKDYLWNNKDIDPHEIRTMRESILNHFAIGESVIDKRRRLAKIVDIPYFGRIDFQEKGENRPVIPVYIGIHTFHDTESRTTVIYDWRAPISSMFYDYELGEASYQSPSGEIKGDISLKRQYRIRAGKMEFMIENALTVLGSQEEFDKKYPDATRRDPLTLAVGDGNHSLATAKACWEELKKTLTPEQAANHPARWCLAEVCNVHSPAIEIEPIHRVLFNVDCAAVLLSLITWSDSNMAGCSFGGSKQQPFTLAGPHMSNVLSFEDPTAPLTVGTIDEFIEYYLEHHKEARVDYVHDEPAVRALCKKGAVAFLMPPFAKSDLFKGVVMGGVLPRKTFSMGHAEEKRYYVECRKITE